MADVFHRIYTHAVLDGFDTTGGRAVEVEDRDAARILPREALAELDDLLRKTTPEGRETAWAVRRFHAFACVIASYPDIFSDAKERAGVLNHARLFETEDATALVELAQDVDIGELCAQPKERRLQAYLDQLGAEPSVANRGVSVAELQQLPREFLEDVLIACLVAPGRRERTRFLLRGDIRSAALAWSAIPFGLQRLSTFALAADNGCPVDAIFSPASGKDPRKVARESLANCVNRYVDLLLDGPHDLTSLLRDREIGTVTQLDEIVKRRMIVAPLEKKNRPRARSGELDELEPQTVSELDRQFRAMEARTRAYVDERLANWQAGAPVARPKRAMPLWAPIAGVTALLIAAVLYVLLWMPPRERADSTVADVTDPVTATEEEPPPFSHRLGFSEQQQQTLVRLIEATSANGQWAEALKALIQSRGTLVASALRTTNQNQLIGLAEQIEDGVEINRDALRRLLVEWIAGVTIDGKLNDITPSILERVKDDYGVTSAVKDAKDIDLQAEIILRWMAKP